MLENEIENLFKCLWTTVCFCLHHKKTKRLLRELLVNNYGDLVFAILIQSTSSQLAVGK